MFPDVNPTEERVNIDYVIPLSLCSEEFFDDTYISAQFYKEVKKWQRLN